MQRLPIAINIGLSVNKYASSSIFKQIRCAVINKPKINLFIKKEPTSCLRKISNKNDSKQVMDEDKENIIFTIPNILTSARIASVPFLNYFVYTDRYEIACGIFIVSAVTDFFDGYIARNWPGQKSHLGSIIDPLADKLLVGSLIITLAIKKMIPLELCLIIIGRDFFLILYSLYIRYKTIEKPVSFEKFINVKKYSPVKVEADQISKINTFLQLSLICVTLPSGIFNYQDCVLLTYLQYLTGFTTLLSSISYFLKRGSYKMIKKN